MSRTYVHRTSSYARSVGSREGAAADARLVLLLQLVGEIHRSIEPIAFPNPRTGHGSIDKGC